ncbi:MAG: NYN domain-containing protein, partial [Acidobacteriota bacterium]|nr:NYN domain-containing protein [Acidobacteriota bacterium]
MPEERLKLAVFIDFDNIQIGVKDTLNRDFDVSTVLEALKERGEVVAKVAYGDWSRAGDQSRQMTQHAIQMVQRSVTPRGDKNGADINLALDALEMAFTRHHINAFAIVGGDSDFMALVEKLKQFDKQVFVIGGRAFTSNILQKNCTEFIAYENLLRSESGRGRPSRRGEAASRASQEPHALSESLPNIQRALKILADRGVAPQLGLLKSTLLQLDSTFTERDYGAGSFLEFMQKVEREGFARLHRTDRGYLVEMADSAGEAKATPPAGEPPAETETTAAVESAGEGVAQEADPMALEILKQALAAAFEKAPGRPLYLRQIRQRLRAAV